MYLPGIVQCLPKPRGSAGNFMDNHLFLIGFPFTSLLDKTEGLPSRGPNLDNEC